MDSDSLFVDVGSNVGIFSLLAASRGIEVIACEPMLETFFDFQKTLDINPSIRDKIIPLLVGLGDFSGPATLFSPSNQSGYSGAQLGTTTDEFGNEFQATVERRIMVTRGDAIIDWWGLFALGLTRPLHIKVDVDGLELSVLLGFCEALSSGKVRSLLVEVAHTSDGNAKRLRAYLSMQGFEETESEQSGYSGMVENVLFERS